MVAQSRTGSTASTTNDGTIVLSSAVAAGDRCGALSRYRCTVPRSLATASSGGAPPPGGVNAMLVMVPGCVPRRKLKSVSTLRTLCTRTTVPLVEQLASNEQSPFQASNCCVAPYYVAYAV